MAPTAIAIGQWASIGWTWALAISCGTSQTQDGRSQRGRLFFGPWSQGATIFVSGMSRFTAPKVLDTLSKVPITVLCAPPTMYRSLVQEDLRQWNFLSLRHCVSAGEPLNEEVIYNWEEATGLVVKEGYGQTETTLLLGTFKKMSKWVKPGSIGKVAPGYDVRIVNNMGVEVARGEQGNIGVRCKPEVPPGLFQVDITIHSWKSP